MHKNDEKDQVWHALVPHTNHLLIETTPLVPMRPLSFFH
jgi:hypothetical protein